MENVQTRASTVEYRADTQAGQQFCADLTLVFRTAQPFLRKWSRVPENYEELYQQVVSDMQQSDFHGSRRLCSLPGEPTPFVIILWGATMTGRQAHAGSGNEQKDFLAPACASGVLVYSRAKG